MPFSKLYSVSYDALKFESPDGTDILVKTNMSTNYKPGGMIKAVRLNNNEFIYLLK
jgi:hypothetical protein